jgi:hypothetical protein
VPSTEAELPLLVMLESVPLEAPAEAVLPPTPPPLAEPLEPVLVDPLSFGPLEPLLPDEPPLLASIPALPSSAMP